MDGNITFPGKKVLVVEDDSINRDLMNDILSQMQCQVSFAHDGVQALTSVTNETFDLILMDIRMPNKDGIQATKEIRTTENKCKNTPIIALTAATDTPDSLKDAGMSDVVTKPLNLNELREKMAKNLSR